MSEYGRVFNELRHEVWKVSFLIAFLNAAIVFFVCNIILTFINERFIYSLIPAVLIFAWSFYRKARQFTLRRIEEGNPEVSEILRTAHDSSDHDNLMVHALFLELMQKMETVTAGVFISPKRAVGTFVIIAVLAFTPVVIQTSLPDLIINNPLDGIKLPAVFGGGAEGPLAPTTPITGPGGDRDLYGDKDVAVLGNQKLDITTASGSGGVDFTKTGDAEGKSFRTNTYPIDVSAEEAAAGTGGTESGTEADLINAYSECQRTGACA